MTRREYIAEADRYEMLAEESRRQVVSAATTDYYDDQARKMRALSESVHQ